MTDTAQKDFPLLLRRRKDGRLTLEPGTVGQPPAWPPNHEFTYAWIEEHSGPRPVTKDVERDDGTVGSEPQIGEDGTPIVTSTVVERGVDNDGNRVLFLTLANATATYRIAAESPIDGTTSPQGVWGVLVEGTVD